MSCCCRATTDSSMLRPAASQAQPSASAWPPASEEDAFSSGRSPDPGCRLDLLGFPGTVWQLLCASRMTRCADMFCLAMCRCVADCACAAEGEAYEPAEDVEPYLDGLRVFLACCGRDEARELARICREGGACRYPQLNPLITHVVVRQQTPSQPASLIQQLITAPSGSAAQHAHFHRMHSHVPRMPAIQ